MPQPPLLIEEGSSTPDFDTLDKLRCLWRTTLVHSYFHGLHMVAFIERAMEPEPLSPETRRKIEDQFDNTVGRTSSMAAAVFRYGKLVVMAVFVMLLMAFVTDYIEVRRNPQPLGSVEIKRYYAVGLKNGKTEMMY